MATEWISRDCVVAALDMCAVLAHYDIRAGRGTSFRIHCPFHEDDRPSCSINPGAKVFNCFACGEQGNVLDFIAGMEDLDPKAEFRAVLEKGIEIIGHNPTPQKSKSGKKGMTNTTQRKEEKSATGDEVVGNPATPSKKNKNRSKVVCKQNADGSLNLEPNRVLEGPAFPLKLEVKHAWLDVQLERIGVNRSVATELGIGFETRSNALMANRICFPIHNAAGDLVAYAGRWASDDGDEQGRFFMDSGREQPRYRLPKGFCKQLELYNWHRVLEQFEDIDTIVLVEGFWSVLRLQAMTIPSAALMGLSISDAQIRLLLEGGIRSVIVMLDGDEEGEAAAETIIPRLASHFFTRSIALPECTKPDDCDPAILAYVKALCACPRSERVIEPRSTQEPVRGQAKPSRKPKSVATVEPVEKKRFALSTNQVTASLHWSGLNQV